MSAVRTTAVPRSCSAGTYSSRRTSQKGFSGGVKSGNTKATSTSEGMSPKQLGLVGSAMRSCQVRK